MRQTIDLVLRAATEHTAAALRDHVARVASHTWGSAIAVSHLRDPAIKEHDHESTTCYRRFSPQLRGGR